MGVNYNLNLQFLGKMGPSEHGNDDGRDRIGPERRGRDYMILRPQPKEGAAANRYVGGRDVEAADM